MKMGFTFKVDLVESAGPSSYGKDTSRMREHQRAQSLEEAWQTFGAIEAMSPKPDGAVEVFTKQNLFAKAVHAAFYGHHPLILSPDVIWLTIAQGLANHIDQNADLLRSQFVSHEGKMELIVERPGFVKGSQDNDWEGVFPEFSEKIGKNSLPGTVESIECDFSTTGPVERIVSHITLMDAVQHYFSYTMCCGCGFPEITLSGTVDDWKKIRAKAEHFNKHQYHIDWWLDELLPALDQFVAAAEGAPDVNFWRSLCNINVGTSMPAYEPLTGWVQVFFPYLIEPGYESFDRFEEADDGVAKKSLTKNTAISNYVESFKSKVDILQFNKQVEEDRIRREGSKGFTFEEVPSGTLEGVKLDKFPPSLSSAPFAYKDGNTNKEHKMAFMGGISTIVQHPDGAIEPRVGWAVLDSGKWEKM